MRPKGGTPSVGTLRYILRDTFRLFFRHWGLSFLTLITAASLFFLVGASSLLALNIRKIAENIQSDLVIQAFVSSDAAVNSVLDSLKNNTDIAELKYISPQEALERLRAKMGSQSKAVTLLSSNPLPWTIEIKVRQAALVAPTVKRLSSIKEIDDLMYSGALAERLVMISNLISNVAIGILAIAVLVSALVFYNTIRISIYSKRQEISVMLLVGSTRSYVASPFMLHGMLLGVLGAVLAVALLYYGQIYIFKTVESVLPFLRQQLQWREVWLLYGILLCAGAAMGWLCSYSAVHRHIRDAVNPL